MHCGSVTEHKDLGYKKKLYGKIHMYLLINTYGQLHYIYCRFTHAYNPVIDRGVGSPGHGKDVVDGLNATKKGFFQC